MTNGEDIRRYTADELRAMAARGESGTDWKRVRSMTEEELEASIASDPDCADVPADWYKNAVPVSGGPKRRVAIDVDAEVLDWFEAQGPDLGPRLAWALLMHVRAAKTAASGRDAPDKAA